jgi:hypothetical protein
MNKLVLLEEQLEIKLVIGKVQGVFFAQTLQIFS